MTVPYKTAPVVAPATPPPATPNAKSPQLLSFPVSLSLGNGTLSNGGSGQTRAGVQFGKNGEVSTESESFLLFFYPRQTPH